VQTHVRKQLLGLVAILDIEGVSIDSEPAVQRVREIRSRLDEISARLLSWSRLKGILVRFPLVSTSLSLIGGTIGALAIGGSDVSTGSSDQLVAAAKYVGTAAFFAYFWVVVPSLALGFGVKRALFAGGTEIADAFSWQSSRHTWQGFPATNVYEAEDRVFRVLGRRKRTEVPLDIILHFLPYLFAAMTLLFLATVAVRALDGRYPGTGAIASSVVFLGGLIAAIVGGWSNYRARRNEHRV
jgi:hypothetical protein